MDSMLPVLTSGCVESMYNMDLIYLTDTWGPARLECTLDLQVLDIRYVRPSPHTGVSSMRCLMMLSDGCHKMRGMLHDNLHFMVSEHFESYKISIDMSSAYK